MYKNVVLNIRNNWNSGIVIGRFNKPFSAVFFSTQMCLIIIIERIDEKKKQFRRTMAIWIFNSSLNIFSLLAPK